MTRPETEKDYPDLRKLLDEFFGIALPDLIREADTLFQQPLRNWLKETHKELIQLRKETTDPYSRSVEILNKKMPGLKEVIHELENYPRAGNIRERLLEKLSLVPESIEETQSEARFNPIEGDTFYVRFIKLLKRTAGRKRFNKQVIPFRDILVSDLMNDTTWLHIWISESYKDQSEILELFLEKPEPDSATNDETEEGENGKNEGIEPVESFRLEVIDEFEKHIEQVIKRIESSEILENRNLDDYFRLVKKRILKKCQTSGTAEGSKVTVQFSDTLDFSPSRKEKLDSLEKAWITCLKSIRNDLLVQNEIASYGIEAVEARENILKALHGFFRDTGYLPIEHAIKSAMVITQKLKASGKKSLSGKLTDELRMEVEHEIREKLLIPMSNEEEMKKTISAIQGEISDLQMEFSRFSETISLAEERELTMPSPKIKFDELKWRALASRHIREYALREMNPENADLITFMKQISEKAEESLQIVDVNLAAAYESKDLDEEEKPLDIALGGVERAVNQFEELIKLIREKQDEYEKVIEFRLDKSLYDLAGVMLSRDYDTFEIQDKALFVKQQAIKWTDRLEILFSDIFEKASVLLRFFIQKLKKGKNYIGRFLGFAEVEGISSQEKRSLSEYLSKSVQELELPFIYRRLFEPGFEIDSRFNIAPDGFYTMMESAYSSWNEGLETNLLILGERGSGKSNAIRIGREKIFEKKEIVFIEFDKTFYDEKTLVSYFEEALGYSGIETVEELTAKISMRRKRIIIVVENLQNAFIRNMHGFEAIEAFWILMSSTKNKIFWIVTISRYTWKFFEKLSSADQFFSHIDEIDTLSDDQIRKAIMVRHKSTGFQLKFEPAQSVQNSRTFKKLLARGVNEQEYLADYYFTRLAEISEGNMSVAIIFWLQSIKEFDEKSILIAPIEIAAVDRLEVPSRNVLFTLAAFAIHDTLNEDQLSMALHQDQNESKLMIARMRSKGILIKTDYGYRMNQLVYRQIIRMLKRRNILH
jgi:hypothetical protein